jgi:hypothetical protein
MSLGPPRETKSCLRSASDSHRQSGKNQPGRERIGFIFQRSVLRALFTSQASIASIFITTSIRIPQEKPSVARFRGKTPQREMLIVDRDSALRQNAYEWSMRSSDLDQGLHKTCTFGDLSFTNLTDKWKSGKGRPEDRVLKRARNAPIGRIVSVVDQDFTQHGFAYLQVMPGSQICGLRITTRNTATTARSDSHPTARRIRRTRSQIRRRKPKRSMRKTE